MKPLRRWPTYFLLAPGRDLSDVERAVACHARFLVVEKIGEGMEVAEKHDPRAPHPLS
jgi:hypothetical protein